MRRHSVRNGALVSAVLIATAISFTPAAAPTARAQSITIGYAVMGFDHPLFQGMLAGAKAAAAKLNVQLNAVDGKFNIDTQTGQLQNFVSQKVDAILVNPVTATGDVPSLQKVQAAGIPVIAIDTRPVGFTPDAYVAANHFQGGYLIAWKVASDLQCKGNWAAIWAIGNEQAAERMRGFKAGLADYCLVHGLPNGFADVGEYSGITGPLRDTARSLTQTVLTKYPKGQLAFVFGQTDEFANGAYLATTAANRSDVLVYGMDNNADIRGFIALKKNLIATTFHPAFQVGAAAVQTAYDIINKKPYSKEVLLNFQLDTQDNVQYDVGWTGANQPSYSDMFWPQELAALFGSQSTGAAPSASAAATPTGTTGGLSGSTSLIIAVVVVLLIIAIAGFWFWRRRSTAVA
jgi:ribose transport system substrate-binding protein